LSKRNVYDVCDKQIDRQISQKCFTAGEMYWTIRVEWANDHFGLGLMQIDPLLTKICERKIYTFSFPVTLTFETSNLDLKNLLT